MRIEGKKIIFSTGKIKYANNGIVGLSGASLITNEWDIFDGYDGILFNGDPHYNDYVEKDDDDLTNDELVELADYMVDLWKKFKESRKDLTNG